MLGGVEVPHETGLDGHSDADVLLHAIADALLGAAALGDIGVHFRDTDPRWRDLDSLVLLEMVGEQVARAGYGISNIDATLALQRPKIGPYVEQMRANVARVLRLRIDQVSVKATTAERLGFVGAEEGAEAYAVCALYPFSGESAVPGDA